MVTLLYKVLWYILCLVFSLCGSLCRLASTLRSYDLWRSREALEQRDCAFLERCKLELRKLPKHLNLIIGPEESEISEEFLSRILGYALVMDINRVSFYDTRLPRSPQRVSLEQLHTPNGVRCKMVNARHAVWYAAGRLQSTNGILNGATKRTAATLNSSTNGVKVAATSNGEVHNKGAIDRYIEIYEIDAEDGRPLLAKVCRDLFVERHSARVEGLLKKRDHLTEFISQKLREHLCKLSEPELSIIFSSHMCTFGMLPWHTRFTEFHLHETGRRFDVQTFAHILYCYSRCEQRWGE